MQMLRAPKQKLVFAGVLLCLCFAHASEARRSPSPSYGSTYESGGDEPEEGDESAKSTTMFLSLTFLILVTVLFEALKVSLPHRSR